MNGNPDMAQTAIRDAALRIFNEWEYNACNKNIIKATHDIKEMAKNHDNKKPRSEVYEFFSIYRIIDRLSNRRIMAVLQYDYHFLSDTYESRLANEKATVDYIRKPQVEIDGIQDRVVSRLFHQFEDDAEYWLDKDENVLGQLAVAIKSHINGAGCDQFTLSQLAITNGETPWLTKEVKQSVTAIAQLNEYELLVMAIILFTSIEGIMSLPGCLACIDYYKEYFLWPPHHKW